MVWMSDVPERLSDLGYAAGWAVVRALPEGLARALFRTGADIAARRQGPDSQLRRNLARVLGVDAAPSAAGLALAAVAATTG